jgi:sterol desaturase/sphingolipid hydroxylase (fatty acid hydroxylase superfamily)
VRWALSVAVAALASFGLLAAVFIPLERNFPARRQPVLRAAFGTDALFFLGQYLAFNLLAIWLLSSLSRVLGGTLAPPAPRALVAVAAVLGGDICVYWFHRACHAVPLLWRFHAVHHSSEQLDWLAAHREHPVDGILTQLATNLPPILLGVPPGLLAGVAAFRGMWAIFVHSNVRLPLGPLKLLLGAPELHHWHHARGRGGANFANVAPWVDLLFGTHEEPPRHDFELGLARPGARGWLASLIAPFRRGG